MATKKTKDRRVEMSVEGLKEDFAWHLQFLAVLHHVAGEGHGEVVAQAFLAEARGEGRRALFGVVVGGS